MTASTSRDHLALLVLVAASAAEEVTSGDGAEAESWTSAGSAGSSGGEDADEGYTRCELDDDNGNHPHTESGKRKSTLHRMLCPIVMMLSPRPRRYLLNTTSSNHSVPVIL